MIDNQEYNIMTNIVAKTRLMTDIIANGNSLIVLSNDLEFYFNEARNKRCLVLWEYDGETLYNAENSLRNYFNDININCYILTAIGTDNDASFKYNSYLIGKIINEFSGTYYDETNNFGKMYVSSISKGVALNDKTIYISIINFNGKIKRDF